MAAALTAALLMLRSGPATALEVVLVGPGDRVEATLYVLTDPQVPFSSLDLVITFDRAMMAPLATSEGLIVTAFDSNTIAFGNEIILGEASVSMIHALGVAEAGPLLSLTFNVLGGEFEVPALVPLRIDQMSDEFGFPIPVQDQPLMIVLLPEPAREAISLAACAALGVIGTLRRRPMRHEQRGPLGDAGAMQLP